MRSARTPLFQGFPRVGIPRAFETYAGWAEAVDVLLRCGAVPEPSFLWCAPHARELGCESDLARVPAMARNSGAERQLARAREGGVSAAMAQLADEFLTPVVAGRDRDGEAPTGGPATGGARAEP